MAGAEPCGRMRDQAFHAAVARRKADFEVKVGKNQKNTPPGYFDFSSRTVEKVRWREARFEIKTDI